MRFGQFKRREFITLLGGAAAWPLAARAQPARLPTIGFLGASSETAWAPMVLSFRQRLSELGWIDRRTVTIVYRWAEGKADRYAEFASEFVRLNTDVIVTAGSAVSAAKRATSTIPIIFAAAIDPLGSGFVASLARPGGNVTGLSLQSSDMVGKRIELIRQAVPDHTRLAVLAHTGYPAALRESAEAQAAARQFGLTVDVLDVRAAGDIGPAIDKLKGKTRALYICTDALVIGNVSRINNLARANGVATMWGAREYCEAGGFISYGANEVDLFRRAGDFVDKILKGTNPADIPVEQPTKIELVINLKTARVLSLDVADKLLALADEVIE